jgi:hypothetical protein
MRPHHDLSQACRTGRERLDRTGNVQTVRSNRVRSNALGSVLPNKPMAIEIVFLPRGHAVLLAGEKEMHSDLFSSFSASIKASEMAIPSGTLALFLLFPQDFCVLSAQRR